jgi:hypothetical protein
MTQPDISLDSAALRAHARMIDQVADMFDEVAAAAGHINLHDEVYGEWPGKLIVPLMNIAQDHASQELRGGTDATSHLAEVVRAVADDADITDRGAAQRLREAGS